MTSMNSIILTILTTNFLKSDQINWEIPYDKILDITFQGRDTSDPTVVSSRQYGTYFHRVISSASSPFGVSSLFCHTQYNLCLNLRIEVLVPYFATHSAIFARICELKKLYHTTCSRWWYIVMNETDSLTLVIHSFKARVTFGNNFVTLVLSRRSKRCYLHPKRLWPSACLHSIQFLAFLEKIMPKFFENLLEVFWKSAGSFFKIYLKFLTCFSGVSKNFLKISWKHFFNFPEIS